MGVLDRSVLVVVRWNSFFAAGELEPGVRLRASVGSTANALPQKSAAERVHQHGPVAITQYGSRLHAEARLGRLRRAIRWARFGREDISVFPPSSSGRKPTLGARRLEHEHLPALLSRPPTLLAACHREWRALAGVSGVARVHENERSGTRDVAACCTSVENLSAGAR